MAAEGEFPKVDGYVLYGSEVNSFLRNAAKGIVPTIVDAGEWNEAVPDNLSNLTDEDSTTSTGVGQLSATGGANARILIDLGSNSFHSAIGLKYTFTSPASTASLQGLLEVSQDGTSYTKVTDFNGETSSTITIDTIINPSITNSKFRYVRLGVNTAGTTGGSVTWQGHELVVF